jgi:hypothetical protein
VYQIYVLPVVSSYHSWFITGEGGALDVIMTAVAFTAYDAVVARLAVPTKEPVNDPEYDKLPATKLPVYTATLVVKLDVCAYEADVILPKNDPLNEPTAPSVTLTNARTKILDCVGGALTNDKLTDDTE